jgi:HEAT repeat protein
MKYSAIDRDLRSELTDLQAQGLRRMARLLQTDTDTSQRPADWAERKATFAGQIGRVHELSRADDEVVRELAVDVLANWLDDAALARLLQLVEDPAERVRASAVGAMDGWPHSPEARQAALDGIDAPHWAVRMRAARALAPFAGSEVDEALMAALSDPSGFVRTSAGDSLKQRDPQGFLTQLRALCTDYPAPHIMDAAVDLLGAVGLREDAEFLAKVGSWFNLSQSSQVRAWCRQAARRIRQRLGSA